MIQDGLDNLLVRETVLRENESFKWAALVEFTTIKKNKFKSSLKKKKDNDYGLYL